MEIHNHGKNLKVHFPTMPAPGTHKGRPEWEKTEMESIKLKQVKPQRFDRAIARRH